MQLRNKKKKKKALESIDMTRNTSRLYCIWHFLSRWIFEMQWHTKNLFFDRAPFRKHWMFPKVLIEERVKYSYSNKHSSQNLDYRFISEISSPTFRILRMYLTQSCWINFLTCTSCKKKILSSILSIGTHLYNNLWI